MDKKRGMLIVVIIVVVLTLTNLSLAQEENIKYSALDLGTWDVDDGTMFDSGVNDHDRSATSVDGIVDPTRLGCKVIITEEDGGLAGGDDKGALYVYEGIIVDAYRTEDTFRDNYNERDGNSNVRTAGVNANVASATGEAYICAENYWWYTCNADTQGQKVRANTTDLGGKPYSLFNCTVDDAEIYKWEELGGSDVDGDGFVSTIYPGGNDCRDDLKEVNPDKTEICGDGIDNDCNPQTSDNCNANQAACESEFNSVGESLPWIDTSTGGFCCGINGDVDIGKLITSSSEAGAGTEYICLNKEKAKFDPQIYSYPSNDLVKANWALVGANTAAFNIFTLSNKEKPYDVVSNGEVWQVCDSNSPQTMSAEGLSNQEFANRFYCYQENDHYSWAECYDGEDAPYNEGEDAPYNEGTIKFRQPGDALYSLPLPQEEILPQEEMYGKYVEITPEIYQNYYDNNYIDFSGYDNLEFFVKFVADTEGNAVQQLSLLDGTLPADIRLVLRGPDDVVISGGNVLFDDNILGYAIDNPELTNNDWIHIKVKISGLTKIKYLQIASSNEKNFIGVRNIYLTSNTQPNLFCSGTRSLYNNAWISDFDSENGKKICNAIYDPTFDNDPKSNPTAEGEAWLEDAPLNFCCGDDGADDYYAGPNKKNNGCWNGRFIKAGEKTMNLDLSLSYNEKKFDVISSNVNFDYQLALTDPTLPSSLPAFGVPSLEVTSVLAPDYFFDKQGTVTYSESPKVIGEFTYNKNTNEVNSQNLAEFKNYVPITYTEYKTTYADKIFIIPLTPEDDYNLYFRNKETSEIIYHTLAIQLNKEGTPITREVPVLTAEDLTQDSETFQVVAETDKVNVEISQGPAQAEKSFSCSQDICVFPLPGLPPYTITYSGSYDLSFTYLDPDTQKSAEVPVISGQPLPNYPGNLIATRVSQQILHVNDPDNINFGFYGCTLSSDPGKYLIPASSCTYKAGYSCAISTNKDGTTTLNTWEKSTLEYIGYDYDQNDKTVGSQFPLLKLTADEQSTLKLNHSSTVFPGRNFLSNAEFNHPTLTSLPYWTILSGNLVKPSSQLYNNFAPGMLKLLAGEQVLSEKIVITDSTLNLAFSQVGTCPAIVNLVNNDGVLTKANNLNNIPVNDNIYLYLQFTADNECNIEQPMLQVLNSEQTSANYSYNSQNEIMPGDPRAATACCPQNSCWNGYACVGEMSNQSFMTEQSGNQNYRCIAGEWTQQEIKKDWNADRNGFCAKDSQCFVLGSDFTKTSAAATYADFYNAETYPICINDGESIFDHYCDNGQWTSRTKFVAEKILDTVGSDPQYSIYCSNYNDALLSYNNEELLGGQIPITATSSSLLGSTSKTLQTCYTLDTEVRRLVPDKENTCINNVCVVKSKEGISFATTLNKPVTDENSFLAAINPNLPSQMNDCNGDGDFFNCNLANQKIGYSPKLNAVFYNLDLQPSFLSNLVDSVSNFFHNLFNPQASLADQKGFITEAQDFNEVYLAKKDNKQVRGLKEILTSSNQTLIIEYENFKTPLCDYISEGKLKNPVLQTELLEQTSGIKFISCTQDGDIQRIEAVRGLDFLWPQLTGKLRISE